MTADKKQIALQETEKYGKLMTDAVCAGKSVRLYEKGYVRVGGAIFRSGAAFERLLGISGSADVAKKTGLGRVAGFALTGGLNVMLTPNKRGDLYLTIVTDVKTHTLHMSPPTKSDMQALHKIVATGESILERLKSSPETSSYDPSQQSAAENSNRLGQEEDILSRLKKLGELHASGVISDDEFAKLKSRIIDEQESTQRPKATKETFSLLIVKSPPTTNQKIDLIKTIQGLKPSLSLKDVKELVDVVPSILLSNVTLEEARAVASSVEAKGATVEIRNP